MFRPRRGAATGGLERQVARLARALAARGHNVSVIVGDFGQSRAVRVDGVRLLRSFRPGGTGGPERAGGTTPGWRRALHVLPMSLPIIGKLLGHTQTVTTAKYAHLGDDPLRQAADRIGSAIANAGRKSENVVDLDSESG